MSAISKNKMKFTIDKLGEFLDHKGVKGSGLMEDPYIITSVNIFPDNHDIIVRDSEVHVIFQNCNIYYLKLEKCQSVKLSDCTFEILLLDRSFNIVINSCRIQEVLSLRKSEHNTVSKCKLNFLGLISSHNNKINDCYINSAKNDFSRSNLFKDIKFIEKPDKYLEELLKSSITTRMHLYTQLIVLTAAIAGGIGLWDINLSMALMYVTIMISFSLFGILWFFLNLRKSRKYRPNKIVRGDEENR
ncbi:MAG: hypothetical protein ACFFD7_02085 [Candidatus Thorarchaeota archaeon]